MSEEFFPIEMFSRVLQRKKLFYRRQLTQDYTQNRTDHISLCLNVAASIYGVFFFCNVAFDLLLPANYYHNTLPLFWVRSMEEYTL